MEFIFSKHALQQIKLRNINVEIVETVKKPAKIVLQYGKRIYQSTIKELDRTYLIRVFVNYLTDPAVIITAYKTSKINKYL